MLKLKANPTFKAKVGIDLPGGGVLDIEFEFKHKTRKAFDAFINGEGAKDRSDVDTVLEIACGWSGVEEPFGREALEQLFDEFHAAAFCITRDYVRELTQARLGN